MLKVRHFHQYLVYMLEASGTNESQILGVHGKNYRGGLMLTSFNYYSNHKAIDATLLA